MVRCSRFEVQPAADLLAAEFSSHDGKYLVSFVRMAPKREGVLFGERQTHAKYIHMTAKMNSMPKAYLTTDVTACCRISPVH